MSKKELNVIEEKAPTEKLMQISEPKKVSVTAPVVKSGPVVLLTFDRYFASLGLPAHHKAGMATYVKGSSKKSKEAWDLLFKNY